MISWEGITIPSHLTYTPWKKKFAWWPVKVHDKRTWLKTYYARIVTQEFNVLGNSYSFWEYGTLFDVMKDM